ncbi:MAG: Ig domain-containing protein [Clostridia bacterium]|nr:Ig domain-containing protein [Clostridia bacterium]
MKKLLCTLLSLCLVLSVFSFGFAEINISAEDLAAATDEELESLRAAVVSEQKSRIVSRISLDSEELRLNKGTTGKLAATVEDVPEGVTAGKLAWSTSDSKVASVANGTVKAVNDGQATITCSTTLSDGTELSAECSVTVYISVKTLAYKTKKASAQIGETYTQEPAFTPANATNKDLVFTSSNEEIATVDAKGEVTVKAAGQVDITATTTDGSEKSASYTLSIPSLKAPETFSVADKEGDEFEVEYFGVTPDDVKLTNSSKNIADVEMDYSDGKFTVYVTPKAAGTTKVTLTDGTDKANQRTIAVTVENTAVYSEKSYPKIKYTDAYRYPEKYEGENVSFSGRVLQVMNGSSSTTLRISSKGRWDNVVYVTISKYDITTPILEDDNVTVYGTYDGNYTYETIMGASVTIPSVDAERINVRGGR